MSLSRRLSPFTSRLAHILATRKAVRVLASEHSVGKPVLAIYFGGTVRDLYQVKQWLPVFEQLHAELPTVILMKDSMAALELANSSTLPIRLAGSADAIEPLTKEWGLKSVFYVNNNLANFSVLRLSKVRHVHLSHGESEKTSMTSNQLKAYDFCFVAGQASADRILSSLTSFNEGHLKMVGRPQLDLLHAAEPLASSPGRYTVLYAPTWEGDRPAMAYSSLVDSGEEWVSSILADTSLRLIYRPHPKTGTRSAAAHKADKQVRRIIDAAVRSDPSAGHRIDLDPDCNPAMISADVAIFDVSAMAMDFSILNRPYFVAVPPSMKAELQSSPLLRASRQLTTSKPIAIASELHLALSEGPTIDTERFINHHFGPVTPGSGIQRFRQAINDVI